MILVFASSLIWGLIALYHYKTYPVADFGGEYIEGAAGQPSRVNPILSQSSDIDSDLSQLVYSGILKYTNDGKIANDLAESYEISDDKLTYTFHLKKGVLWHDGQPFTSNDIMFTINLINNPAYKSPLRLGWQGVAVENPDDNTVVFKLEKPYVGFLHNLTFGILPKHLWGTVEPEKFALTSINLEPIGTGPYKFSKMQKDSEGSIISYELTYNSKFFDGRPYISKITFNFYEDEDKVLEAFNRKEIMGMSGMTSSKISNIKILSSTMVHHLSLPRYFAVFINQTKSVPLSDDKVREALAYATDRQEVVDKVFAGNAKPVYSPILPGMLGYKEDMEKRELNLEKAEKLLEEDGWKKGDDGIRKKGNDKLEFNLATVDWEELVATAEIMKSQWEKVGARVNLSVYSVSDIKQNLIRPREYEALLFGQVLGADPDPYSYWHSNEKKDPGLNLSLFGNSDSDKIIEDARVEFNEEKRADLHKDFQKEIAKEIPAIFLYTPDYLYVMNKKVNMPDINLLVSPSERFSNIKDWYINTDRLWK